MNIGTDTIILSAKELEETLVSFCQKVGIIRQDATIHEVYACIEERYGISLFDKEGNPRYLVYTDKDKDIILDRFE